MTEEVLSLESLNLELSGRKLIENFSLCLNKGDKAVITGRSGSGKSTLLNIIMGFNKPDSGNVTLFGQALAGQNISALRKRICWLPQNVNLIGGGKTLDAIYNPFRFSANRRKFPEKEEIITAFEAINLPHSLLDSDFAQLSGGERQRVGMVICKLLSRKLILLDEPTSALDKDSRKKAAKMFLSDNQSAVLSVSHDEEWIGLCNKIVEM